MHRRQRTRNAQCCGRATSMIVATEVRHTARQFGTPALDPTTDGRLAAKGLRPRIPRRRVDAGVVVIPIIPAEGIVTSGATFSYRVRVDEYQATLHFGLQLSE